MLKKQIGALLTVLLALSLAGFEVNGVNNPKKENTSISVVTEKLYAQELRERNTVPKESTAMKVVAAKLHK